MWHPFKRRLLEKKKRDAEAIRKNAAERVDADEVTNTSALISVLADDDATVSKPQQIPPKLERDGTGWKHDPPISTAPSSVHHVTPTHSPGHDSGHHHSSHDTGSSSSYDSGGSSSVDSGGGSSTC